MDVCLVMCEETAGVRLSMLGPPAVSNTAGGRENHTFSRKRHSADVRPPSIAARAVALLGATIESFGSNIDGTLTLAFSNQHRLTILDSSKEYESYDITRPGQTIIV